jgi:hypothetical protein
MNVGDFEALRPGDRVRVSKFVYLAVASGSNSFIERMRPFFLVFVLTNQPLYSCGLHVHSEQSKGTQQPLMLYV